MPASQIMDVAAETISQSNVLIDARYSMTLGAKQVLLLAAAQLDPSDDPPPNGQISVTVNDYARVFEVDVKRAYEILQQGAEALYKQSIRRIRKSPRGRAVTTDMRWVSKAEYAGGTVTLWFTDEVLPHLTNLRRSFTTLHLAHVAQMGCVWSVRLYELMLLSADEGEVEYTLKELRQLLGCVDQYADFKDFHRHVIAQSVEEVNEYTPLEVTYHVVTNAARKAIAIHYVVGRKLAMTADATKVKRKTTKKKPPR